ncbi:C39 family peptidase [Patescibacteria group bacterium]|nr:C39 family peptidase [Patescibacteria group bacterium]
MKCQLNHLISKLIQLKDYFVLKRRLRRLAPGDFLITPLPHYYSQHTKTNWRERGERWKSKQECEYWEARTCAIGCLQMVISTKCKPPSIAALTQKGLDLRGYNTETDAGWFHHPLVKLAKQFGLDGKVLRYLSIPKIIYELSKGRFIIASVNSIKLDQLLKDIKRPARTNVDHMVLLVGYHLNNKSAGFYLMNPSYPNPRGPNQPFFIKPKSFLHVFNHRGISLYPCYKQCPKTAPL